jgi:hypothetical protein
MKSLLARALVLVAVAGLAAAAPAPVAAAQTQDQGFYVKSRFLPEIYRVSGSAGMWEDEHAPRQTVSFDQWVAAGRPQPLVWDATYVAMPWGSTIYAVTFWPDRNLYQQRDGEVVELSYAQWASVGRPAPDRSTRFCEYFGCIVQRYPTSPELFMTTPYNQGPHKLTLAEWRTVGSPPVSSEQTVGFYRLAWSDRLFSAHPSDIGPRSPWVSNIIGERCGGFDYATWRSWDFPTPQVVTSTRHERYLQYPGDPTIYYDGSAGYFPLTFQDWQQAGSPAPAMQPWRAPSFRC